MKKELKEIILKSVPKKYHRKLKLEIDKYDTIQETYYFRLNVLIILAIIVIMLLIILRLLLGINIE